MTDCDGEFQDDFATHDADSVTWFILFTFLEDGQRTLSSQWGDDFSRWARSLETQSLDKIFLWLLLFTCCTHVALQEKKTLGISQLSYFQRRWRAKTHSHKVLKPESWIQTTVAISKAVARALLALFFTSSQQSGVLFLHCCVLKKKLYPRDKVWKLKGSRSLWRDSQISGKINPKSVRVQSKLRTEIFRSRQEKDYAFERLSDLILGNLVSSAF